MADLVEQYFKLKGLTPPPPKKRGRPKSKMTKVKEGKRTEVLKPDPNLKPGELDPDRKKHKPGRLSTLAQPKKKGKNGTDGRVYANKNDNVQQCSVCGHLKEYSLDNFYYIKRRQSRKSSISTMCRKCRNKKARHYAKGYKRSEEHKRRYVDKRAVTSRFPEGTTVSWVEKNFPEGCVVCENKAVSKLAPIYNNNRKIANVICYDCYQAMRRLYWDTNLMDKLKGFTEEFLDEGYDIVFKGIRTKNGNALRQNYVSED